MKKEEDQRPDPEELLSRLHAAEEREGRGALKIFFGAAPGVGKTFAMLEGAQRLKREGVDVLIGCIETHGRKDTQALIGELEVLPRHETDYRGTRLPEFDLEGALRRKPTVLLLDELAHTNAPGSRHKKRWQDAFDLLDAGIDVHTTLNVQHLESLNDVVLQVTGVRVRETVPDAVLERADHIELVDLPPDELLERLAEGKVYTGEAKERAMQRFFRRGNLLALRELALRRTAQRVDVDVLAYRREHAIDTTWAAGERILVCVGPAPASAGLVRAARRMADGLRAPWVAACVDVDGAAGLASGAAARLDNHLRFAESLGGEVVRLTGVRVSDAILAYARQNNVTRLIIGKPTHSRWRDLIRGSLLDEVVRGSGTIDVHVTSGSEGAPPVVEQRPQQAPEITGYVGAGVAVAFATGLSAFVRPYFDLADIVMLYLLAIVGISVRYARGPSILAAGLSVVALDFFFVPPLYTFTVSDSRHLLTFGMLFMVSVLISGLMLRIRRQERSTRIREGRTHALYALVRELGAVVADAELAKATALQVERVFECQAAVLLAEVEKKRLSGDAAGGLELEQQDLTVARWVQEHGRPAGFGTDTLGGSRVYCAPLLRYKETLGVAVLLPKEPLDLEQRSMLDALLRQAALAVERSRLAEEAKSAALKARTEELRSSLLSAVSHDLRTPLAAITGAATSLLDPDGFLDPSQHHELLTTICEEAERLERLVGNLLDMTRLESGGLRVKHEWVPVEELVGSALTRLEPRLVGRKVTTRIPEGLPLVAVDPVLIEQVFVNLFENAAKYTPPQSPIDVHARAVPGAVIIEVADEGPGLPPGSETRVFEKFFRGPTVGASGVGLGLAICRGIVEAHGGTITAENRPEGGALFRMTIPIIGEQPMVPEEPPTSSPREDSNRE